MKSYPGYITSTENGQTTVHLEEAGEVLRDGLNGIGGKDFSQGGRGSVTELVCENGHTAIIRPYLRGGLIQHINKNRYLSNRAETEYELLLKLHADGLPVPKPLGMRWTKSGLMFQGTLATEKFDGCHLQEFLMNDNDQGKFSGLMGKAIGALHEKNIFHADLQVRNLLVDPSKNEVLIIDFDKAFVPTAISPMQCQSNWRRLLRSFRKNNLSIDVYSEMLEAYAEYRSSDWVHHLLRSL